MSRLWNNAWELCLRSPRLRRLLVRAWYESFTRIDHTGAVRFMNYGYAGPDGAAPIALEPTDEPNRYQIQLYRRVAGQVDLSRREVLEVGSGRGGGAAHVAAQLGPQRYLGVDISRGAVRFCQRRYALPHLHFQQGDAEKLDLAPESFDAVINIESSSHYGSVRKFLSEVRRVLRPGGDLLFADIRETHEVPGLLDDFHAAGLEVCQQENISHGVARALDLDEIRKLDVIRRTTPQMLHGALKEFGGLRGSEKYVAFQSGRYHYLVFLLRKPVAPAAHSTRAAYTDQPVSAEL